MKFLAVFVVFIVIGLTVADQKTHSRGCIYIVGRCARECEEGTHAYAVGCDYLLPEPTCKIPKPEKDLRGQICDFSACYCDPPTVRDEVSKKCVTMDNCPKE